MNHTPGPWTFGYYGCNGYCINGGGQHIATSVLYKRDGGEANAKLIAAAPDLLRELETLLKWADGMHRINELTSEEGAPVDYETFPTARAAIEKATS